MSTVVVYNKEPRWIGLPNKIDLAPGANEVDEQLLETVKHFPTVRFLFDSKSLTIRTKKESVIEEPKKPIKKAKK